MKSERVWGPCSALDSSEPHAEAELATEAGLNMFSPPNLLTHASFIGTKFVLG